MPTKVETITKPHPKLSHFKSQEKKMLAKQERIKTWPKEHQADAQERVEASLNHIREEMKKLA